MKRSTCLILLYFSLLFYLQASAQTPFYQRDTSIKVFAYGQQQTLAWCGGFNTPQFTMGDLNHDGLQDLVVFEPWVGISTFINMGTAGNHNYRYAPEYALNFPPVYDYLILADYNCDGIPDLFQQGHFGFAVYKGYYNSANQLCFTYYKDLFYYDTVAGSYNNAFNNPGNIPAIVDIDNDGDLDFITFNVVGGNMYFYKNLRTEMGLSCDSIRIELADECWGRAFRLFNNYQLGSCNSIYWIHQGNSLCLFDYDMDGDYDLLNGNSAYNQMAFLQNGRIPLNSSGPDSMVSQDTAWQSGGTSVNLYTFPAAFNVDVDQDGKNDLLISPSAPTSIKENYNCIWYYKNQSAPGSPDWQFQSDSFLTDKTIDLGTAAYPMLFDYNKDGKPDLFIGSDGYYQSSTGVLQSRISYYKNTSTPGNPSFTLQTRDFLGMNAYAFQGSAIGFGDIDNDGKTDLIVGHTNGTLSYFKNMAANDTLQPDWQLMKLVLTDANGDTINVGGYAAPFIYDIDKDGKKDLLIGNMYGTLQYYQNVSTVPGTIHLKLVNTALGHISVDPHNSYQAFSAPFIGKIDTTGTEYLLMGSNSGNLYRFTGFQGGDTTATYAVLDSQFSFIDSTFNYYYHPGTSYGVYSDLRSTVTIGEMASDAGLYMIVGNAKGGVELYKNGTSALQAPVVSMKENGLRVYPNPATNELYVEHAVIGTTVKLFNMLGQKVYDNIVTNDKEEINTRRLTPGIYMVQLTDNNGNRSVRTIVKE